MKTNIKRVLCLLCAMLMLVFALTACGGESKKAETTSKSDGASSTTSVVSFNEASYSEEWKDFDPYANIPESSKGVTVRFATWIDHTETEGAVPLANF